MISSTDFRTGLTIEIDGGVWQVVEFQHVKPGKGAAFVRTKIKNVETGAVVERTFNPNEKMPQAPLDTARMAFLYETDGMYTFMDNETYEQIEVEADMIGDNAKWLLENDVCLLQYANGVLFNVQPPMFIEVEITETDPGFKGDTVQGGGKPATIETGAVIQVPMYLNVGERIQVDTRDGKFVKRI